MTEFKCTDGKLYLLPILDVFNHEIVAYAVSRKPDSKMVMHMPDKVFGRLKVQMPLLHSDQGMLYRTSAYLGETS